MKALCVCFALTLLMVTPSAARSASQTQNALLSADHRLTEAMRLVEQAARTGNLAEAERLLKPLLDEGRPEAGAEMARLRMQLARTPAEKCASVKWWFAAARLRHLPSIEALMVSYNDNLCLARNPGEIYQWGRFAQGLVDDPQNAGELVTINAYVAAAKMELGMRAEEFERRARTWTPRDAAEPQIRIR